MEEWELVWTEPAVVDLEGVAAHIARQNPAAAGRVTAEIVEHVSILRSFPYIGPLYPRDPHGRIHEITCRKYRIFYRVLEEAKRVEILTVWHGARQEPQLPG